MVLPNLGMHRAGEVRARKGRRRRLTPPGVNCLKRRQVGRLRSRVHVAHSVGASRSNSMPVLSTCSTRILPGGEFADPVAFAVVVAVEFVFIGAGHEGTLR